MSSAWIRPLGLRARFTLWSTLILAASLGAGFAWVHLGLGRVLDERNVAFLDRKAVELLAGIDQYGPEGTTALAAELRREVLANAADGLIVVVRQPGRTLIVPDIPAAHQLDRAAVAAGPASSWASGPSGGRFRVLVTRRRGGAAGDDLTLKLGMSLAETDATLAAFDRQVGGGALAFLALAAAGGLVLARQALRPVAASIRAARRLDPEQLAERLPLTGAGDDLDELAATINDLLDRLVGYHAQIIRLTADASHELRSPLAAMRAAIEVALQRPRDAEAYRQVLATLGDQAERLTTLVNGLLLLAQADAGAVAIRREPVDLAPIARDVAELFEPLADERGLRLTNRAEGPAIVDGDPARLRQLVTNLLDNAIRFTPPGGSVVIEVEPVDDWVTLQVADTGIGVADEDRPHLFERFFQADPARTAGSGLGLSICRWIAQSHGGTIAVAPNEPVGTRFVVTVPRGHVRPAASGVSGSPIDRTRDRVRPAG